MKMTSFCIRHGSVHQVWFDHQQVTMNRNVKNLLSKKVSFPFMAVGFVYICIYLSFFISSPSPCVCAVSAQSPVARERRRDKCCASTSVTKKWTLVSVTQTTVLPQSRTVPCLSARPAPVIPDLRPHQTPAPGTCHVANPTNGGLDPGARWGFLNTMHYIMLVNKPQGCDI